MVLWEMAFGLFIAREEKGPPRKSQKHSLKNMNNDCSFSAIYKLISERTKEKSKSQIFKSKLAFQNVSFKLFLKSTKKKPVRIVDVVGQGTILQQMENTSSLFSFEIGRCSLAQLKTMETRSCPGKTDQEMVFMEKLHPKSQTMETRPQDSATLQVEDQKAAGALD